MGKAKKIEDNLGTFPCDFSETEWRYKVVIDVFAIFLKFFFGFEGFAFLPNM